MSPAIDAATRKKISLCDFAVEPHLRHLFAYLCENGYVRPLDTVNEEYLSIFSHEVLHNIRKGYTEWEKMVPAPVCEMIKSKCLFEWHKHGDTKSQG